MNKGELQRIINTTRMTAQRTLDKYLKEKDLDALVMINNDQVLLSALAGYPELSIPAGYETTGKPIGVTFIGRAFCEHDLLKIGYSYEQLSKNRKTPRF